MCLLKRNWVVTNHFHESLFCSIGDNTVLLVMIGCGIHVMRKFLLVIALVSFFGCSHSDVLKPEGPPSLQEKCLDECLNVYSSCILECDRTREIGNQLDSCVNQCKQQWSECGENCSKEAKSPSKPSHPVSE